MPQLKANNFENARKLIEILIGSAGDAVELLKTGETSTLTNFQKALRVAAGAENQFTATNNEKYVGVEGAKKFLEENFAALEKIVKRLGNYTTPVDVDEGEAPKLGKLLQDVFTHLYTDPLPVLDAMPKELEETKLTPLQQPPYPREEKKNNLQRTVIKPSTSPITLYRGKESDLAIKFKNKAEHDEFQKWFAAFPDEIKKLLITYPNQPDRIFIKFKQETETGRPYLPLPPAIAPILASLIDEGNGSIFDNTTGTSGKLYFTEPASMLFAQEGNNLQIDRATGAVTTSNIYGYSIEPWEPPSSTISSPPQPQRVSIVKLDPKDDAKGKDKIKTTLTFGTPQDAQAAQKSLIANGVVE